MAGDKIYITLVNWNNYSDTIECIASLRLLEDHNFQIVVVDNGSTDQSMEIFQDLMGGNCQRTSYPEGIKEILADINFAVLHESFTPIHEHKSSRNEHPFQSPILFISKTSNTGFAGGQNTCFKFILDKADFSYAWMLNNDTIVKPNSLNTMVKEIESDEKVGMVGSVLVYESEREKIQTIGGGKFYPLLASTKLQYKNVALSSLDGIKKQEVLKKIDFLMGASVLVRKEVIEKVGLLDEAYFVYAEEMDWMHRMKKLGWKLSVALDSIVYHKDSSSTKNFKEFYYYQLNKNHMIFLRKHYGIFFNLISISPALLNMLRLTRKRKNLYYVLKGLVEGIMHKTENSFSTGYEEKD